jgi:CheY-like chemotaxis protein/glycine cleavage system H lipoate-binding protein
MEKGKRILVLDDDPVVGLSCKRILGAEGYVVSAVAKGEDAIKRLSNEEIDLLISDIRLPDIYGIEVLREARQIQPKTDVVIITGYPTLEDAKEAIRLGAFEYLEKPFTPEFMINVANRVFDKRGWILRKAFIDQFKQYITPMSELDEKTIFYKEGTWARPLRDGRWEIGFDVRHWFLGGQLLYVDIIDAPTITSGQSFARLLSGDGRIQELKSPMTGVVDEKNEKVNETVCSLATECLSEGWLMWLLRVKPVSSAE